MRFLRAGRGLVMGSAVLMAAALAAGTTRAADAARRGRAAGATRAYRPGPAHRRTPPRPRVELAASLRRSALDAEPAVTLALRATMGRTGGVLVDLDRRIKPSSSLVNKLRRDQKETGATLEEAGRGIADVLRYKVVLPFERYEPTRRRIVRALERRGFAVLKNKDNWGTRYPGHNLQIRTPDGYRFEVQFQTAASHAANQRTHGLYRRFREAEGDEATELERRIVEITGGVPIPRGVGPGSRR